MQSAHEFERNSGTHEWAADYCWLAACDRDLRGRVSPHLLDRFAVRVVYPTQSGSDIAPRLLKRVNRRSAQAAGSVLASATLSAAWKRRLRAAKQHAVPDVSDEAIGFALAHHIEDSPRADLALVRSALTLARLRGDPAVTRDHVDAAAEWGRFPETTPTAAPDFPTDDRNTGGTNDHSAGRGNTARTGVGGAANVAYVPERQAAYQPGAIAAGLVAGEPNGEPLNEALPLQPPPRRTVSARGGRGAIIGVRSTRTLDDLSIYHTVMEAVKQRNFRLKRWQEEYDQVRTDLMMMSTDLRAYRRAPVIDKMLMLVIDYSSLRDCNWRDLLVQHYLWPAYVERAQIGIVRVGARESPSPLEAERLIVRNLLDLRVFSWLNSTPGSSTPLAHGLFLAHQHLQATLSRKLQPFRTIELVIFTDARGNVPLMNSRSHTMPDYQQGVGAQGYTDAVAVAQDIRRLRWVNTTLFSPPTHYYSNLLTGLADALGTRLRYIELAAPEVEEAW